MLFTAIMGAVALAAGLASSIAAGVKSSQARKEIRSQQSIIDKQHADQEALFNRQYYQDITDRTEVQDMLRKLDEQEQASRKRDDATATIMGASDEAKIAMADSRNKSRADAIAGIASNASMLKDQYLNDWKNRLDNYYGQQIGMSDKRAEILKNDSDQWAQTASNAYKTGFDMWGDTDWSKFKKDAPQNSQPKAG